MTTKTMTAAEAQTYATQLATQERDLANRKAAARLAATFKAYETSLAGEASALSDAAHDATEAWSAAGADPTVGLDALWGLWITMRATSNVRSSHVALAAMRLGEITPRRNENSGQPQPYRADIHDPLVNASFIAALEGVISARVLVAVNAHRRVQDALVTEAADNAANAIS